jgi:hypothetical protein
MTLFGGRSAIRRRSSVRSLRRLCVLRVGPSTSAVNSCALLSARLLSRAWSNAELSGRRRARTCGRRDLEFPATVVCSTDCATRWHGQSQAPALYYVGLTTGIKLRGPEGAQRLRATSDSMSELDTALFSAHTPESVAPDLIGYVQFTGQAPPMQSPTRILPGRVPPVEGVDELAGSRVVSVSQPRLPFRGFAWRRRRRAVWVWLGAPRTLPCRIIVNSRHRCRFGTLLSSCSAFSLAWSRNCAGSSAQGTPCVSDRG